MTTGTRSGGEDYGPGESTGTSLKGPQSQTKDYEAEGGRQSMQKGKLSLAERTKQMSLGRERTEEWVDTSFQVKLSTINKLSMYDKRALLHEFMPIVFLEHVAEHSRHKKDQSKGKDEYSVWAETHGIAIDAMKCREKPQRWKTKHGWNYPFDLHSNYRMALRKEDAAESFYGKAPTLQQLSEMQDYARTALYAVLPKEILDGLEITYNEEISLAQSQAITKSGRGWEDPNYEPMLQVSFRGHKELIADLQKKKKEKK